MSGAAASIQAPFDSRITRLAMPMQSVKYQITRGFMIQAQALPGYSANRAGKFIFSFLYNPSTVEATYYVQTSGGAVSYLFPNAGDVGDLAVPINQSVSWTVMFDRTYELNSGSYNSEGAVVGGLTAIPTAGNVTADPTVYGVLADIYQLQFFTGMMLTGGQAAAISQNDIITGSANGSTFNYKASQGFMMMVPCYVYFGGNSNQTLRYYGYISEWDVTVTHFTQYMVPMRCVIDITFTMLPPPAPNSAGSGSYSAYPTPSGQAPKPVLYTQP